MKAQAETLHCSDGSQTCYGDCRLASFRLHPPSTHPPPHRFFFPLAQLKAESPLSVSVMQGTGSNTSGHVSGGGGGQ